MKPARDLFGGSKIISWTSATRILPTPHPFGMESPLGVRLWTPHPFGMESPLGVRLWRRLERALGMQGNR